MRALAIIVFGVSVATTAHAAPWSFDLPAGYEEDPGATNGDIATLKAQRGTIDADAQLFMSPNRQVGLVRLTWTSKLDKPASQELLVDLDRTATHQGDSVHLSDERKWVGKQLVADSIESMRGKRLHQRRIYSVDASNVMHVFAVTCMGSANELGACEKAQLSMKLVVPNEASLPGTAKKSERGFVRIVGGAAFAALVIGLIAWVFQSARRGNRRRRR